MPTDDKSIYGEIMRSLGRIEGTLVANAETQAAFMKRQEEQAKRISAVERQVTYIYTLGSAVASIVGFIAYKTQVVQQLIAKVFQ
jgi:hypothetical protein